MKAQKKNCLILKWTSLPPDIKERVKGWVGFHNNCLIPVRSEFSVKEYGKGMAAVEAYYEDQKATNGSFSKYVPCGTLEGFIKAYGLYFDVWFVQQNFDLEGIDRILVEVSW